MDAIDLAGQWRDDAVVYRRRGQETLAAMVESFAADLEQWWVQWQVESLTLQQAAEESGYSYSQLQSLVAAGRLENLGVKNAPRVRRGDLPRKPGRAPSSELDLADRVLRRGTE